MGQELVQILTPATAFSLLQGDKLNSFLSQQKYQGKPLADRLGGWLEETQVLRGKEMACYHKEWAYFSNRFKITCVTYIEAKPGIPPTPGHVQEVIALMRERRSRCSSPRTTSTGSRSSRWPNGPARRRSSSPRTPRASRG